MRHFLADQNPCPRIASISVQTGEWLFLQANPMGHLSLIQTGGLVLYRRQSDGTRRALGVMGRGQLLGLRALLGEGALVDACAMAPTRLCLLNVNDLARMRLSKRMVRALLLASSNQANALMDAAAAARLPNAEQRVAETLRLWAHALGTAEFESPSREVLAELACCAPETVSRAMTRLEHQSRLLRNGRRLNWAGQPQPA